MAAVTTIGFFILKVEAEGDSPNGWIDNWSIEGAR